tara:strand:- start:288 stop:449 length:162 start_codon:yes stop_codon:yes gene_type:complete
MPKVGSKHYSYDAKGMAEAKAASQRSGKPMTNAQKKSGAAKGFNGTPKPKTKR